MNSTVQPARNQRLLGKILKAVKTQKTDHTYKAGGLGAHKATKYFTNHGELFKVLVRNVG